MPEPGSGPSRADGAAWRWRCGRGTAFRLPHWGAEPLHRTTVTLTEMGRSFERASANGLAWTPLASLDAAMVGFVRKASECVANDPALWVVAAPQC